MSVEHPLRTVTVQIFGKPVTAVMLGGKTLAFEQDELAVAMSEEQARSIPELMRQYFSFLGDDGLVELTRQGKDRMLCETVMIDRNADPVLRAFATAVVEAHMVLGDECASF